jgi:hypothetical protein
VRKGKSVLIEIPMPEPQREMTEEDFQALMASEMQPGGSGGCIPRVRHRYRLVSHDHPRTHLATLPSQYRDAIAVSPEHVAAASPAHHRGRHLP